MQTPEPSGRVVVQQVGDFAHGDGAEIALEGMEMVVTVLIEEAEIKLSCPTALLLEAIGAQTRAVES